MRSSQILNITLITCFVIAVSFSIYFYIQAKVYQSKITDATIKEEVPSYHFALIGEEMDHDYWRLVGEGAKDMEEKYNVFVEYEGPRRSNPKEQLKLLDMAIKSKVDGIIVQALNDEFLQVINQAVDQGIPVITIDTDAPESKRSTYIGTDNYEAGNFPRFFMCETTGSILLL
ncbi:ribose transport system substrate-binding protein [Evansella caseinilytica]|uniref:Ribose transport system substrate-binding protein n=1 Tax=Evansella caseinilytica TaxID=1503961 RepID=A0A1H3SXT7_9BACI|nr:substrate-binding domain-containing protein [Evansella caseinilytica]SDZ42943.1 ribose transport system substrate-binding protein [Evansella caseinilytica]